jgi:uncharacterized membrane protein
MSNLNPPPVRRTMSSTWITVAIIAVVVIVGIGYYMLYQTAPNVSPVATEPSPAPAAASPTTLPTPSPSTPATKTKP